jgi:hypothetical protein
MIIEASWSSVPSSPATVPPQFQPDIAMVPAGQWGPQPGPQPDAQLARLRAGPGPRRRWTPSESESSASSPPPPPPIRAGAGAAATTAAAGAAGGGGARGARIIGCLASSCSSTKCHGVLRFFFKFGPVHHGFTFQVILCELFPSLRHRAAKPSCNGWTKNILKRQLEAQVYQNQAKFDLFE